MTNDEIKTGVANAQALMAKCYSAMVTLQAQCKHEGHKRVPKGNTGNYDPSADSYWYECHCGICDKCWNEDQ